MDEEEYDVKNTGTVLTTLPLLYGQRKSRERGGYAAVSNNHPQPQTQYHRGRRSDGGSKEAH